MQVPSFTRGFKRFMSRRGIPDAVVSDNFKTFQSIEVKSFMLQQIIQKFILPSSPSGGILRKACQVCKNALEESIGKTYLMKSKKFTL